MIPNPRSHVLSRRRFLGITTALAGGLALNVPFATQADEVATQSRTPLLPGAWRQLSRQLRGTVLRPGDRGFPNLSLPNNLRYRQIKPGGIALCEDAVDISTCLTWARRHGVPLRTRGGGHSYAGYSSTEGLMISLRNIDHAHYDANQQTVSVGGGILNGSIYSALNAVDRSITHGRCPTVGAGGFLLGGGIGFDMRHNGFASDKLLKTEMVLANGDIVTASANENSDLFWACRGGAGGNFGINTSFTLETFPVDRSIEFQIGWANVSDEFLTNMFFNMEQAPNELGSKITLQPGLPLPGQPTGINVGMIGQFIGPMGDLMAVLAPINAIQAPASSVIQEMAFWSASSYLADPGTPGYYQERSRFVNGPMSADILATIREWLPRWPNAQGSGSIKFFQTGGETHAISPTETAFVHRQSQWLSSIDIVWTPGQTPASRQRAHRWQNRFYEAITPLCGGGAFQNFPDPDLDDWAEAYYGENLPRLRQIKTAVDPNNLFKYPQSIRPL